MAPPALPPDVGALDASSGLPVDQLDVLLRARPAPQIPTYTPPDTSAEDAQIRQQKAKAQAAEKAVESQDKGMADESQRAAQTLRGDAAAEDQLMQQMPSSRQFYQHAMQTGTLLTMLSALGGKATGLSGTAMLGALNGIVGGVNSGAADKTKEAWQRWQQQMAHVKDRFAEQKSIYDLMLNAYQGRADAAQKARDFALSMTGDAMSTKEAAVKDSIDLWKSRASVMGQLERQQEMWAALGLRASQGAGNPQTVATVAEQIAHYKYPPLSSFVMRTPWGQQVMARVAEINPQYDAKRYTAEQKAETTAAGIAGKVSVADQELKRFAPIVEQASAAVPRRDFVPINQLFQKAQQYDSNPQLKQLRIAINSLLNAYDVLAARGGTDVAKREEAHKLLMTADSPEALKAGLQQFMAEAEAASESARAAVDSGGGLEEPTYTSKGDVVAAYKAGKITYDDAAQILRVQFGVK